MSTLTSPLATLAGQLTPAGATAPIFADILQSFILQAQSIFGSDVYLPPDSQDQQIIALVALAINDCNQMFINVYQGFAPSFSQGVFLSMLVKINGLLRLVPTNSTALVTITGVAGTQINGGVVQDTAGNLWNLPGVVIIPGGGSIQVTATAQLVGSIQAASGTLTIINTPTVGWQSVTNASAAVAGSPVESDAALRQRQAISTAIAALTPLGAISAAIANLAGVTRSFVYENQTASTDSNGVPSHTINAIVQGGNATQIAQTIQAKKSPGTGTSGATSITVNDPQGVPITIKFDPLTTVTIYVSFTIKALANYVATTGQAAINAIVNFLNTLPIGSKVFYNQILAVAGMNGNLTYNVTALTTGIAPSPTGTTDISIPFNEAAATVTANVLLTTT